ncbi:MAG: sulfotransferase [Geobacteraceae bacterium]|nr:sulfotransferase [Geobacteraceae bacterium]
MSSSPIFIIGTERSGTNLLRLILNSHPDVAVPHPPHIVKLFTPLLPLYGDLANDRNFIRLISDVCRLVELHPYPWEIRPDRGRVFREAAARELICIYFAIYDQYLEYSGKKRWCCKSTFMIDHIADILRFYPDARFIFMVRDGRDVAVSAKSSIFNHYHVFYSARRWQREQRLGLDWLKKLLPEQIRLLRYEELTTAPEKTVSALCEFLALPYDARMLEYHRMGEAKKSGSLSVSWENTSKPVMSQNRERFRTALSTHEIRLFEAVAGDELQELDYAPANSAEYLLQMNDKLTVEKTEYQLFELSMKMKTELRHLLRDKNSAARIKKNLYMAYLANIRKLTRYL